MESCMSWVVERVLVKDVFGVYCVSVEEDRVAWLRSMGRGCGLWGFGGNT